MAKKINKEKSICCNAEIDIQGGGYIGEDIAPILDVCKECGQTLRVNGVEQEVHNPKTGEVIEWIIP